MGEWFTDALKGARDDLLKVSVGPVLLVLGIFFFEWPPGQTSGESATESDNQVVSVRR